MVAEGNFRGVLNLEQLGSSVHVVKNIAHRIGQIAVSLMVFFSLVHRLLLFLEVLAELFLQIIKDILVLNGSLIFPTVPNVFELKPERIPDPPPEDLNVRKDHNEKQRQEPSAFYHERRNAQHPGCPHDQVQKPEGIIKKLCLGKQQFFPQEFMFKPQQPPISLQIDKPRNEGRDNGKYNPVSSGPSEDFKTEHEGSNSSVESTKSPNESQERRGPKIVVFVGNGNLPPKFEVLKDAVGENCQDVS